MWHHVIDYVQVVWRSVCVCGFCLWQLYNEEILDLFDGARDPESRSRKSCIKIHEDASGSIYTSGVTSRLVQSEEEVRNGVRAGFSSSLVHVSAQCDAFFFSLWLFSKFSLSKFTTYQEGDAFVRRSTDLLALVAEGICSVKSAAGIMLVEI